MPLQPERVIQSYLNSDYIFFFQKREYLCASNTYSVLPFSKREDSIRITWNLIFRDAEQSRFLAASNGVARSQQI